MLQKRFIARRVADFYSKSPIGAQELSSNGGWCTTVPYRTNFGYENIDPERPSNQRPSCQHVEETSCYRGLCFGAILPGLFWFSNGSTKYILDRNGQLRQLILSRYLTVRTQCISRLGSTAMGGNIARTGHGDFADYHKRFKHENAHLLCQCDAQKAPLHFFFCRIAKRRAPRPPGPPSEIIPFLLGSMKGAQRLAT
jgi:hypothetical protein